MSNSAPSFQIGDAKVTTAILAGDDVGESVAVQIDGKIIVAGRSRNSSGNDDFATVRYNSDGSLDTSFGTGGKVTVPILAANDGSYGMAIQPDGKIVLSGLSTNASNTDFAVVRLNTDGTLDTSFGSGGKLTTPILAGNDDGQRMVLQADSKIVVQGASHNGTNFDFSVVRYNSDGSLDSSFGSGGKVTTPILAANDTSRSISLQSDGKIVLSGYSHTGANYDFALVRYNSDGSLDSSFGSGGKVTTPVLSGDDIGRDMALQSDGKIIVVGDSHNGSNYDIAVVRYNADGSLDTSFGSGGKVTTSIGTGDDGGYSVTIQPDGKILVAATTAAVSSMDFALVRYNTDGSLDTSFGSGGKVTTPVLSNDDWARSITIQSDGKIVVAGQSHTGSNYDFSIVRYNADGSLDLTFDGVNTLDGAPSFTEGGAPVVLDSNVQIYDAELVAQGHYDGASLTLARSGGANADDVYSATGNLSALTEGSALVLSAVTIGTVTQNSGGTLVLTFNTNATQARVNEAMRSVAYANTSDAPPATAEIVWTFSDGDTGSPQSAVGSTTVSITGVNDPPFDIALSSNTVDEGAANTTVVGSLSASDPDDTSGFTFELLDDADGRFAVSGSDLVVADGAKLDYESSTTHSVTVRVKDSQNLTYDEAFQIKLNDLNDTAPVVTTGTPQSVKENTTFVASLTSTDADTVGTIPATFSITGGADAALFDIVGGNLVFKSAPDYETDPHSYVVEVTADDGTNTTAKTITVNVTDNTGLAITGTSAADVLVGADDDDEIFGLGGNDTLIGLGGNDYLDGGAGYDTASYASDTAGVVVNLITGTATGAGIGTDTLVSIERVIGGSGSDIIIGTDLSTGQRLDGGAGDDYIEGSFGNDTLIGGLGNDHLSYASTTGDLKVSLALTSAQKTGGAGTDTISGFEYLEGGFGNDTLTGSSGANSIWGREGNDIIDGGGGNDFLRGKEDNDTIIGGAGADSIYGDDGNDTASYMKSTAGVTISLALGDGVAQGGVGDGLGDKLYSIENLIGSAKNDVLTGDGNDNVVEGGLGNDTLTGGANGAYGDTLSYRGATAAVIASLALQGAAQATGGGGTDTASGFENLEGGAGADKLTGDANNNKIAGNAGNDIIYGGGINGAGDDTLDGGAGNDTADYSADTAGITVSLALGTATGTAIGSDTLIDIENVTGGTGDDTIEASDGSNKLIGGLGTDELSYANTTGGVKVSLGLTSAQVTGGSGTDTISGFENLTGGSGNDILTGTAGVNVIKGGDGGDTITGGAGGDFLYGEDGDDVLIGGTGADKLFGGAGSDTASYATSALGVTVDLGLGSAPQSSAEDASGDQLDSIENLIGSAKADALTGDANDNVIEGGLGNDTLDGGANGAGGDTVSYASATASVIVNLAAGTATGGGGTDTLSGFENVIGGKGADTIISTIGSHILNGGAGIDTVSYASESSPMIISLAGGYTDGVITDTLIGFENVIGSSGDNIIEGDAGNNKLVGGLGDDTLGYAHATSGVKVSLALTSAQVTGGAGTDTISGFENLSGGDFNDVLTGDTGTNSLRGWDGADTLSGGGGSDTLMGDEGDDVLIGGAGADKLYGGDGNDTASYAGSTAGVTVDLNLVHQNGAGDESGDDLYDIENLIGSAKNDTLTGDGGDNVIEGGLGNDTLAAGTHGATGDTASYRSATAAVKVSLALQGTAQATGGGGTDLLSGFENLEGGSGSDTLTGDANANVITGNAGNDIIDGGAGIDTLIGGLGSDTYFVDDAFDFVVEALNAGTDTVKSTASQYTLSANIENLTLLGTGDIDGTGNELANIITGNSGANVLSGGTGDGKIDTMKGGLGDDVYYVEAGDKVTELSNQGTDWVHSVVSYTLGSYVENLQLEIAGGNINGTGNTLANIISGNVHDNVLNGKAGNDRLIGGDGLDTFVFNTTLNATTNVDTIADFVVGQDLIHLENAIFTKVGAAGALSADAFWAGVAAHDATDRIIYDSSTGALYYDRDGTGTAAQVQFAVLENKPATLSEADFLVI